MLSLVADYEATSSSSSEEYETDNEGTEEKQSKYGATLAKPSSSLLLPRANLLLNGISSKCSSGDVFNNPFLEAEKLEIDKLQKHVKMVESENHLLQKNGRKICWNNRKGRCRFGNKCKYAHDSDLVEAKDVAVNIQIVNKQFETPATPIISSSFQTHRSEHDLPNDFSEKFKNRKRPGLGDCIVPGKRVMKTYHSTKKSTL